MLVRRDCFAREEIHKKSVTDCMEVRSCSWCGNHAKTSKGKKRLWKYSVESDGGRNYETGGMYCSNDCFYTYHGVKAK